MITRRNWLLRCSILINIAVLLYICSHVMIGSGNLTLGPAFVIQEDYAAVKSSQSATVMRPNAGSNGASVAMLQAPIDMNSNSGSSVHERQSSPQQIAQESAHDTDADAILDPESNQVKAKTFTLFLVYLPNFSLSMQIVK